MLGSNLNKRDFAVHIQSLCKSYGDETPILQNFCMNAKKGTIYSLLGSSGCGKTTILSCIVGLENWESGEVLVFGKKLNLSGGGRSSDKLGYMPQDLALYRHLNIREIIQFYGQIYNMTNPEISEMYNFLCQLLDLPINFTLIENLSGGQKRRVSLALAMLHSPDLLVLDEPTAGVDPLLRKKIWDYLYKLVKSTGITVLLTTHYIEEARHADTIGVMRKGRLLIENSPSNILNHYNCHMIQDAVLYLCQQDESMRVHSHSSANSQANQIKLKYSLSWKQKLTSFTQITKLRESEQSNIILFRQNREFDEFGTDDNEHNGSEKRKSYCGFMTDKDSTGFRKYAVAQAWQRIYGFTNVLLLTFLRNPIFLLLILILPTLQATLSLLTTGSKPTNLHLGIVNHELLNWSTECSLPSHSGNSCGLSFLSCQYLNHLKRGDLLILDPYSTESQARAQVHLGKSFGYIMFPNNFSENSVALATSRLYASNGTILGSRIHTHLDYSETIQISLIVKHLFMSYLRFVGTVAKYCDFDGQLDTSLHFRPPVYGPDEDDFSGFVLPGGVTISVFGISLVLTSVSLVSDRKEGNVMRAKSAGLSMLDITCGHLLTQAVVTIPQLIIWNVLLRVVYNFVILGPIWLWIFFSILVEMTGAFVGLFLGQVLENERQVLLIIIFMYTIFIFFGCAFLPIEWINKNMQTFAYIVPTYLPNESMRSIVVRGAGITHSTVWPGLASVAIWIGLMSVLLALAFRYIQK